MKINVRSHNCLFPKLISDRLGQILPNGFDLIEPDDAVHILEIEQQPGDIYRISKNGNILSTSQTGASIADVAGLIESQVRLTVAEYAVGKIFLHAGVVGWRGRALIIPGSSFAGKTTLVAELLKNGAEYYSDEYAVLDSQGLVYPYPKMLSMRGIIDDYKQFDMPAESFGAKIGTTPIQTGLVLISRYDKNTHQESRFEPEILSAGQGIMEILAHSISVRNNPDFTLKVLNKIASRAIIAKSQRGEANFFVIRLIEYLNKTMLF